MPDPDALCFTLRSQTFGSTTSPSTTVTWGFKRSFSQGDFHQTKGPPIQKPKQMAFTTWEKLPMVISGQYGSTFTTHPPPSQPPHPPTPTSLGRGADLNLSALRAVRAEEQTPQVRAVGFGDQEPSLSANRWAQAPPEKKKKTRPEAAFSSL